MSQTNGQYLMTLHNRLSEHFSFQEMRTFSFYLGVDHESVAGDTKPAWIRELLIKLAQKGRLQELVDLAQKDFPQGNFPNVPPDFALPASLAVPAAAVVPVTNYNYYGDQIHVSGGGAVAKGAGATAVGNRGVNIGGANSGHIVTGDHNTITQTAGSHPSEIAEAFAHIRQALDEASLNPAQKSMAKMAVKNLEEEAEKGADADEETVQNWFDALKNMVPDIAEVVAETLMNPIKGLSVAFQKVAAKARGEA